MDVSVRELKNHLSEYRRRVQAGEEIVVTSHGKRVARLAAVAESPREDDDPDGAAIARLRAQSWIRPGKSGRPLGLDPRIKLKHGEKSLSKIVSEQRG